MLFSQNNIPYKLKTKSSSPLHVMDSAVLGSMKQPLELIHTFLVRVWMLFLRALLCRILLSFWKISLSNH